MSSASASKVVWPAASPNVCPNLASYAGVSSDENHSIVLTLLECSGLLIVPKGEASMVIFSLDAGKLSSSGVQHLDCSEPQKHSRHLSGLCKRFSATPHSLSPTRIPLCLGLRQARTSLA